jgi:hypothetical protein
MNKLEQVIGRTIRTCSHSTLPLNKRNVTIYLHATHLSDDKKKEQATGNETADIHAYKISARKLFEMKKAEQVIRNSALDCRLMINTNYYPKALFQFPIEMNTSQNNVIQYSYGDSIDMQPECNVNSSVVAPSQEQDILIPSDIYENILPSIISKIKNYLQKELLNRSSTSGKYVSLDEIINVLKINKKIALTAIQNILYPNVVLPNIQILPYQDGIILKTELNDVMRTEIKLPSVNEIPSPEQNTCDIDRLLSPQNIPANADFFVATYKLYTDIDSLCWPQLAKRCIETRTPIIDRFADYLAKTGALITKAELPKIIYDGKYIGYINIFNTTQFQVTLYDPKTKTYRDPTDLEMRQLKATRDEFQKPVQKTYGILMPRKNKKNPNDPIRNELKIITPGPNAGKGAECSTKKWNEIRELLDVFEIKLKKDENVIKSSICFTLGVEMFRKDALLLYPEWKPKST